MPPETLAPSRRTACAGLFTRREIWTLSWRGWLAALAVFFVSTAILLLAVHPFLAVTSRVRPDVLVIEGWVPDYALVDGWWEFERGHYSLILTVGEPFRSGVNLDPDDDYGDLAAYKLRKYLGKNSPVQAVRAPLGKRDRTYTCALTVREWLAQHHYSTASVTVATLGTHARRSRLLYEKAFGPDVPIGIVSLQNHDYDAHHWWRFSEGVREVVGESIAYLYVRLCFYP